MGPSVFTENARRHLMLEINSPEDGSSTFNESDDCKRTLVETYFAAVSDFLPGHYQLGLVSSLVVILRPTSRVMLLEHKLTPSTCSPILTHRPDQRPSRPLLTRRDWKLPRDH